MDAQRKFPQALHSLICQLGFSQQQFAEELGISDSLVTKLLKGERAHENSYVKIFRYCRTEMPQTQEFSREQAVMNLWDAYAKDMMAQFEIFTETNTNTIIQEVMRAQKIIGELFRGMGPQLIFALYSIAQASLRNEAFHNLLMSLAQCSLDLHPSHTIPKNYFQNSVVKHADGIIAHGGTFGEQVLCLQMAMDHSKDAKASKPGPPRC